jgi:alpha-tubulin suppressor-like RCC1 family protein
MKHVQFLGLLALTVITACNTVPAQNAPMPTRVLGAVELSLDSAGVSSLRFANRVSTLREADVVFGTGTTQVITSTVDPYNYLVATFPVSHAGSSTSAFSNLTLYAQAKAGNVGSTAIQTIANFGGVTNPAEQARLAKLVAPVDAVTLSVGNVVLDTPKADFQAFTTLEVATATALATPSAMTASDSLLNYGFSARCDINIPANCTTNSRIIALGKTGFVTLALRVPKSASAYKFLMNFVVMDESVSRVTRSLIPVESVATTETRGLDVTATELMQFGLNRSNTTLSSVTVNDVSTSSLNASIFALSLGRISAGSNGHSCGLDAAGKAYCWGNNNSGQLGNNDPTHTNSIIPVAVSNAASGAVNFSSITAGDIFTCGLSLDGTAYCWGSNFGGRLGNTAFDSDIPVLVSNPVLGQKYANISAGYSHTCMTTVSSNIAYCWGDNSAGQLGIPITTIDSNVPVLVSGFQTFVSLSAGNEFTCGIAPNFVAYCWGNNDSGQLGNNDPTHTNSSTPVVVDGGTTTYSSISTGNSFSCAINLNKNAFCWGSNNNGQLGNSTIVDSDTPAAVNGGLKFSSIATGGFHTCAVAVSGDAYCWGFDGNGQLGNGLPLANVLTPSLVSAPTGGAASYSSLSVGFGHVCSISTNGNAFCWGLNTVGQLGNNSSTDSDIPTRDAATSLTL